MAPTRETPFLPTDSAAARSEASRGTHPGRVQRQRFGHVLSASSPPPTAAAGTPRCSSARLQTIPLFPFFNEAAGQFASIAKPS